ncbi:hypothetical protein ACIHCQ_21340 [Streptomyces sp. NPDC052236]|uniref:hypothetical protein n=1 Tax=Streptomyces sp. NPDC052236 TaxID=3365686 RepID=UPI0037CF7659
MTPSEATEVLLPLADHVGPRPDVAAVAGTPAEHFPPAHRELLLAMNGFTVYHGTFRMLGIGRELPSLDLAAWNAPETWRFAWDDRIDPYVIFAESAFGDSYAYRRSPDGGLAPEVLFLEGVLLQPEPLAGSFEEFLADEFVRNARKPYDRYLLGAVDRSGPIAPDKHWTYAPSVALGAEEDLDNLTELPAVTERTFAGDLATAMENAVTDPVGVVPWTDDRGRARLRVLFGTGHEEPA